VTIKDIGGATTIVTNTATVADAKLTSSNGTELTGIEGNVLPPTSTGIAGTLLGSFIDANPIATTADFLPLPGGNGGSIVINWGGAGTGSTTGTIAQPGGVGTPFLVYGSFTYNEPGTYAVTVTVTDDGGQTATISDSAIITDAPLTTTAITQPAVNTVEASVFPIPEFGKQLFTGYVATFNDTNPVGTVSDFKATIDWGDGTPRSTGLISQPGVAGTPFDVTGSHTYADAGVNGGVGHYPITVYVTDEEGSTLTVFNTANVQDNPILLTGTLNPASDSGKYHSDGITKVTQPNFEGTSEPFSHVTVYANGVPLGSTQTGSDGSWSLTSNIRLADGNYAISATAIDQFGKTTTVAPVPIYTNFTGPAPTNTLVIDTVGPRVVAASFNRFDATVTFTFEDFQQNGATPGGSGLLLQSLYDANNYSLNRLLPKPAGTFVVTAIYPELPPPGSGPFLTYTVNVQFNNGHYIKGGFFEIIARSESILNRGGIQDVAGNALDGEYYGPNSASGNGVPGGDFIAKITEFHRNNSGPITIIGYPHPNDPPGNFGGTGGGTTKTHGSTKKTVVHKSAFANRQIVTNHNHKTAAAKVKPLGLLSAKVTPPPKVKVATKVVHKHK